MQDKRQNHFKPNHFKPNQFKHVQTILYSLKPFKPLSNQFKIKPIVTFHENTCQKDGMSFRIYRVGTLEVRSTHQYDSEDRPDLVHIKDAPMEPLHLQVFGALG